MTGSYMADHGIKVCLSTFCYDRNTRQDIPNLTYTDHIIIISYWGLKSMCHAGSFKTLFYMLHNDAYKVHLISGSLILQIAVAIIFV